MKTNITIVVLLLVLSSNVFSQEKIYKIKDGGEFELKFAINQMEYVGQYEGQYYKSKEDGKIEKAHGIGAFSGKSLAGDSINYNGNFYEGQFHGNGKIVYEKGNYISVEGDFVKGVADGKGVIMFRNKDIYEGEIKNWLPNGNGTRTFGNGDKLYGKWKDDLFTGNGTLNYDSGSYYTGDWVDSKFEGKGYFKMKSGNIMEGLFRNSMPVDSGKIVYIDGSVYIGGWGTFYKDGKKAYCRTGRGVYKNDDVVYDGFWLNDVQNGAGKEISTEGIYEGNWKDGVKSGFGKIIETDGSIYEGNWEENWRHGQGKDSSYNGVYVGNWVEGYKDGFGMMIYRDGRIYEGNWIYTMDPDDRLTGEGKIIYPDGRVYEGSLSSDLPNGEGKMVYPDKTVEIGTFNYGVFQKPIDYFNINEKPTAYRIVSDLKSINYVAKSFSDADNGIGKRYSNQNDILYKDVFHILNLDVISYYALSDVYNTDLKLSVFKDSEEYREKLAEITELKNSLKNNYAYIVLHYVKGDPYHQNCLYNCNFKNFDLAKQGFKIEYPYNINDGFSSNAFIKEGIFNYLFLSMDKSTGLKVEESNKADLFMVIIFKPTELIKCEKYNSIIGKGYNKIKISKFRLMLFNEETGEIYHDKIYN